MKFQIQFACYYRQLLLTATTAQTEKGVIVCLFVLLRTVDWAAGCVYPSFGILLQAMARIFCSKMKFQMQFACYYRQLLLTATTAWPVKHGLRCHTPDRTNIFMFVCCLIWGSSRLVNKILFQDANLHAIIASFF